VFGLCGHGNIQFIDALYERSDDIKTISVHHESVAGFMADVYYRVSGQAVATFTSCGPGSANLPIALGNAYLDSVPFLAVTGNVPTSQFNRGAFQELYRHYQADFPSTVRVLLQEGVSADARRDGAARGPAGLEDHGDRPPGAGGARRSVRRLHGSGRRGSAEAGGMERQHFVALRRRSRRREVKGRRHAAGAERPVILVGQGVRYGGAAEEAAAAGRAAANSGGGSSRAARRHRHQASAGARAGRARRPYQANHATRQADVLLALGVRFDDRTSSSWIPGYSFTIPPTKLIHVDIDPEEIGRNYPVALGLMADVRTFLRQVLPSSTTRAISPRAPRAQEMAGADRRLSQGMGQRSSRPAFPTTPRRSIRSAPRSRSTRRCRRRDPGQRHRRAPQLAAAVLQAEAAGLADRLHGFRPDGLWRRRRAGREVRGARPSLRIGVRRRRVLHACQRARHRGRI
jgi:acetolactate synthase-1/2/3 large subunit